MMHYFLMLAIGSCALVWLLTRLLLGGVDLAPFDGDAGQRFASERPPSPEIKAAMARLATSEPAAGLPQDQRLAFKRSRFDRMFDDHPLDASFTPLAQDGVRGEWVLAPGADPARRMLYIHGGGLRVGSARSHRTITARMSELSGGAVLALDYRLLPEHHRRESIADCRNAYQWMLEHGPAGAAPARAVFVAGDSAGGNLTLSLLQWVRDQGLRQADAAVAISPPTDSTFSSPSIRTNMASDYMLGPAFAKIAWMPRGAMLWIGWFSSGIKPTDPMVSPVHGDLARLPPTLVHVSETEMLFDDARRYVNRARAAGSPATLQSWNHTLHVWHIFNPELPEAREAFAEIGKFLNAAAPQRKATP
jgi:monoterpene epsilon-lactone hydrolase